MSDLEADPEGILEAQRRASEAARATAEAGAAALGGIRAFETYTLERFKQTPANAAAFKALADFNPRKDNIFLAGTVGTGKTHLAVAGARANLPRVAFLRQAELSREVRGARDAEQEGEIIRGWASVPVLILDDLGAAKDTEFMVGLLYEIIDWRYMNRPGGLIVTSNRTLDQLAEKLGDDRIPSRLAQMCKVLKMTGKDHRIEGWR